MVLNSFTSLKMLFLPASIRLILPLVCLAVLVEKMRGRNSASSIILSVSSVVSLPLLVVLDFFRGIVSYKHSSCSSGDFGRSSVGGSMDCTVIEMLRLCLSIFGAGMVYSGSITDLNSKNSGSFSFCCSACYER